MNAKDFITKLNKTGKCEVNTDAIIAGWNNRCVLLRWEDDYRIMESIWRNGKTNGDVKFKIGITKEDAIKIIESLKLNEQQSFLRSGKSYRTAKTEAEAVIIEQMAYIKQANSKIRQLKRQPPIQPQK